MACTDEKGDTVSCQFIKLKHCCMGLIIGWLSIWECPMLYSLMSQGGIVINKSHLPSPQWLYEGWVLVNPNLTGGFPCVPCFPPLQYLSTLTLPKVVPNSPLHSTVLYYSQKVKYFFALYCLWNFILISMPESNVQ